MNKIKELEQKIKELQEEISKLKSEETSIRWEPSCYDTYYYIATDGTIGCSEWGNDEIDNWRYHNRKIFKTGEECKQYKKFIEDVNKYKWEFTDEDWETEHVCKYFINCVYPTKKIIVDFYVCSKLEGTVLKNLELLSKAKDFTIDNCMGYYSINKEDGKLYASIKKDELGVKYYVMLENETGEIDMDELEELKDFVKLLRE